MDILLTGTSSFTGFWIAEELINSGHEVTITLTQKSLENYSGVRRRRLDLLAKRCNFLFQSSFGEEAFLNYLKENRVDAICHHAHDNRNYRSPDYDAANAVKQSTLNLTEVLELAKEKNENFFFIQTGTVIEDGEGFGEESEGEFFDSPYGKSKFETYLLIKEQCEKSNIKLGKFVIPNPFGPMEEDRFTNYLMNSWNEGVVPTVKTPDYIRDNIHVTLLAKAYSRFVKRVSESDKGLLKLSPSQYVEPQGQFALRFAFEMEKRLPISCPVEFLENAKYSDPMQRVNTDSVVDAHSASWSEDDAWGQIAEYYKILYKIS